MAKEVPFTAACDLHGEVVSEGEVLMNLSPRQALKVMLKGYFSTDMSSCSQGTFSRRSDFLSGFLGN